MSRAVWTRRAVLSLPVAGMALGFHGVVAEPLLMTRVTRYAVTPPGWPAGRRIRIAALADIHACEPWMGADHISRIVQTANALNPDVIVLLGDYVTAHDKITALVPDEVWAGVLGELRSEQGTFAILGNHDWWADREAQARGRGPIRARTALEKVGIQVLENDSVRIRAGACGFWIAGLGDQWAIRNGKVFRGVHDLDATLAGITDDAPVILLVHEPDIFPEVPQRVSLTLAGHTHGGQVVIFGQRPVVPSRYGSRYAYGHIVEKGRNLIVSAGLGCSWWPVRFGAPPEIVLVELGS